MLRRLVLSASLEAMTRNARSNGYVSNGGGAGALFRRPHPWLRAGDNGT
jgi:hypothetical protein